MKSQITQLEIEKLLRKYPKARKIAIENFLFSCFPYDYLTNIENCRYDAFLYNWNNHTVRAILEGLKLMLKEVKL